MTSTQTQRSQKTRLQILQGGASHGDNRPKGTMVGRGGTFTGRARSVLDRGGLVHTWLGRPRGDRERQRTNLRRGIRTVHPAISSIIQARMCFCVRFQGTAEKRKEKSCVCLSFVCIIIVPSAGYFVDREAMGVRPFDSDFRVCRCICRCVSVPGIFLFLCFGTCLRIGFVGYVYRFIVSSFQDLSLTGRQRNAFSFSFPRLHCDSFAFGSQAGCFSRCFHPLYLVMLCSFHPKLSKNCAFPIQARSSTGKQDSTTMTTTTTPNLSCLLKV